MSDDEAEDQAGDQEEQEPPQQPVGLLWVLILPLLGAAAWGLWAFLSPNTDEPPPGQLNAFNLAEAPKPENRFLPGQQQQQHQQQQQQLPAPAGPQAGVAGTKPPGSGLGGFVTESSPLFVKPKAAGPASSKMEQEFVKKWDSTVKKYQDGFLEPLAKRYYKQYPIVREVDRAFARLPGYMAVSRQYTQDRDMYKWARGVIALPEVRKTAMKYAMKPEVWKVAIQMSLDALKNPPPKPVYNEMQRFITADKDMADFIGSFAMELIPHLSRLLSGAIPTGADMRPLQNLVANVAPPDMKNLAAKQLPPAQPTRRH